jgi:putative component of membrane protein insertase Oxa1/YidC/SpoIIIJ protein YidD
MFRFLNTIFVSLSVFLIRVYQVTLSPDKGLFSRFLRGRICAHHPHCSAYTIGALRRFGFWRGRERALSRIGRCRPSSSSTYDPVAPRVVFFSSAPIGIPFLKYLFGDSRFDLVGVVTMPDAPV